MNKEISLFVLAAGMGSRYGGLKQMEGFGPNGETIIDYSIYDALKAGFTKIVFVIKPDMEDAFNEIFMSKYKDKVNISYVFQSLDKVPDWYEVPVEREKPWGTGHALLMAKDVIKEPSLIINGDDFYGREAFEISAKFLREECNEDLYEITAYKLKNVLSENGTVKRGVCEVEEGLLKRVEEIFEIGRGDDGVIRGAKINGEEVVLDENASISMNMFGVHPSVFESLEKKFGEFLKNNKDILKGEFLLPTIFNDMVSKNEAKFKILQSDAEWFGVTYKEDAPYVRERLKKLVDEGVYPSPL
ncbi:MAG: nucleotidyltransferase family protein [Candidatus Dojkabacteria bacterium]|jgi:choline kinase